MQTNAFVKITILRQLAQSGRRVPGPGRPDGEIGSFWYHFRPDRALAAQMVKLVRFGTRQMTSLTERACEKIPRGAPFSFAVL